MSGPKHIPRWRFRENHSTLAPSPCHVSGASDTPSLTFSLPSKTPRSLNLNIPQAHRTVLINLTQPNPVLGPYRFLTQLIVPLVQAHHTHYCHPHIPTPRLSWQLPFRKLKQSFLNPRPVSLHIQVRGQVQTRVRHRTFQVPFPRAAQSCPRGPGPKDKHPTRRHDVACHSSTALLPPCLDVCLYRFRSHGSSPTLTVWKFTLRNESRPKKHGEPGAGTC